MTTMLDLAKRLIPNKENEALELILWNHTPYPFSDVLATARSLRQWKRHRDAGLSNCAICGDPYNSDEGIVLGGECAPKGCLEMERIQQNSPHRESELF